MRFEERYQALNQSQRQAVDQIDGPVMVVAGPGTGKTELLSMRVANILKKTDTLPQNILCLTFTESGAMAMRQRLSQIIGTDAYRVNINTFHGFGSEIINQNSQFFYHGADFQPADDLERHEIMQSIFDKMSHTNPLASTMNDEYTQLSATLRAVGDLKKSGLTSDELEMVLKDNQSVMDAVEGSLQAVFAARVTKATIESLAPLAEIVANLPVSALPAGITPLSNALALSIAQAVDEARATNSTKPVTAWKSRWMKKNRQNELVFKDRDRQAKLSAVSKVYLEYLTNMQTAALYDYDDMILRTVHALEIFDELRFNLQEQYQYILVDEFQDTNLAQLRILHSLTNNPANENHPNIMVVGDDDQAIYSFQGADVSNILDFRSHYPSAQIITLTDNYRSGKSILTAARQVIVQGDQRLENTLEGIDKTLTAQLSTASSVTIQEASDTHSERQTIVSQITELIRLGKSPSDIVVLARRHQELVDIAPLFSMAQIAVNYEKRDNVFDLDSIQLIINLSRVVNLLRQQRYDQANALLPELMMHPAWNFSADDIWQLSLKSYKSKQFWFETIGQSEKFVNFYNWLLLLTIESAHLPLETMIDLIIGAPQAASDQPNQLYVSPIFEYYFAKPKLDADPNQYLTHLGALRTFRQAIREHASSEQTLRLNDLIEFVDSYQSMSDRLTNAFPSAINRTDAINLMTAHSSKGLEFDTVFIIGATEKGWGQKASGGSNKISYPENLPLAISGQEPDERLRLFFVAMTRAKTALNISYSLHDENNKPLEKAGFLTGFQAVVIPSVSENTGIIKHAEAAWYLPIVSPLKTDLRTAVQPMLESYQLSVTHLTSFLDVSRGGPNYFLVNNLLRFPSAMSPAAAYGLAVHNTLQKAHNHVIAHHGSLRPIEDLLLDFSDKLSEFQLNEKDFNFYEQKGIDHLGAFLGQFQSSFTENQLVELDLKHQNARLGDAHLTGKLDLVDIDKVSRQIVVTDYKTGKPAHRWQGSGDYEKIKLHHYRQQLMFYKLLLESSRSFSDYIVTNGILQFVEPDGAGAFLHLESNFNQDELDRLTKLIQAVWQRIVNCDFPDTSQYGTTVADIIAFEEYLLANA